MPGCRANAFLFMQGEQALSPGAGKKAEVCCQPGTGFGARIHGPGQCSWRFGERSAYALAAVIGLLFHPQEEA
jgi:hypothetical protein